jgi:uncharacterized membrane-anchored protein
MFDFAVAAPLLEPNDTNAIWVFLSSFLVAAAAGFASLLRTAVKLTWISVFSALLNSGLVGLSISLLWYHKFHDNLYFLVGLCIIAGLGGATTVDFLLKAFMAGGLSVKFSRNDEEKKS